MRLLYAILFGNTGRFVPLVGLLASAVACGLWLRSGGQLPPDLGNAAKKFRNEIPNIDLGGLSPTTPKAAPSGNSAIPIQPAAPQKPSSIFDFSPAVPAAPAANSATALTAPSVDIQTLQTTLESARIAAASRLGLDYTAARVALIQSDTDLQKARAAYPIGGIEVTAASQRHMTADSDLKAIEQQLRNDPAVVAAERCLKAAQGSSAQSARQKY